MGMFGGVLGAIQDAMKGVFDKIKDLLNKDIVRAMGYGAAYMIWADRKVEKSEVKAFRNYIKKQKVLKPFIMDIMDAYEDAMDEYDEAEGDEALLATVDDMCLNKMKIVIGEERRKAVIRGLCAISIGDGELAEEELDKLKTVAEMYGFSMDQFKALLVI